MSNLRDFPQWLWTMPEWSSELPSGLLEWQENAKGRERYALVDLMMQHVQEKGGVTQCQIYAPYAGTLASPIKEVPLLLSMIFAQHKRLMELEKRIKERPGAG
jgi:hypothetical protein